jgi:hypothetical protein
MPLTKNNKQLVESIRASFVFRTQPAPVPSDLRPEWKIAVLVLGLSKSGWAGKMSLKKAHVLNWAVRDHSSRTLFLRMMEGDRRLEDVPVRFDPSFNRALDYAAAERLVSLDKKTTGLIIGLLPAGLDLVRDLEKHEDCLISERAFFDAIGRVSQERIQELLDWETDL